MAETPETHDLAPDAAPDSAPRAIARGTGILLQTVGTALFLSTCCVCSLAGRWDPVLSHDVVMEQQRQGTITDWSLADLAAQPHRAGMMLMAMFMTVGGLAFLVFGLGMQSEKRGSATGALLTALLALLILAVAGAGLWIGSAAWAARVWHALMALVVLAITPLIVASWRQMLRDPPAPDLYDVPADFDVDAYKRQLREQKPLTPQEAAERRAALEAEVARLREIERRAEEG